MKLNGLETINAIKCIIFIIKQNPAIDWQGTCNSKSKPDL